MNINNWTYEANPTKMYLYSKKGFEHVAQSNLPRLCEGDVVIIKAQDLLGRKYWEKQGIKSYVVKVIKKLSAVKREHKDSKSATISYVPEVMLTPYITYEK